jgi:shikimate dehydrogenase
MTDHYAVIGNPIAHSRSPEIHAEFARQTGEQMEYGRILGEPGRFETQVRGFFAALGKGLNVTVPFKEQAWRVADEGSDAAQAAEAANTLILLADGRIRADNTDGVGLIRDLTRNHGVRLDGREVLLVGAGGAARGVLRPLLAQRPRRLVIANRTADRAIRMAAGAATAGPVSGCGLDGLGGLRFDLIINATAAGLQGGRPLLPEGCLRRGGVAYDMLYSDRPTPFLVWASAQGAAQAVDGLGMLVEQAAEAFYLWRGVRPATAPVMRLLRPDYSVHDA